MARAMELVSWDEGDEPRSLFLKVNLLSREVMPGRTSPWVFEAVCAESEEALSQSYDLLR